MQFVDFWIFLNSIHTFLTARQPLYPSVCYATPPGRERRLQLGDITATLYDVWFVHALRSTLVLACIFKRESLCAFILPPLRKANHLQCLQWLWALLPLPCGGVWLKPEFLYVCVNGVWWCASVSWELHQTKEMHLPSSCGKDRSIPNPT